MNRIFLLFLSAILMSLVLSCASTPKDRAIPNRTITTAELSAHDGTAWIAVDGIVYDVTHNKSWCCGSHHGIKAGQDLSERIRKSPHGKKVLAKLPIIGRLGTKQNGVPGATPAPIANTPAVQQQTPAPQPQAKEEPKEKTGKPIEEQPTTTNQTTDKQAPRQKQQPEAQKSVTSNQQEEKKKEAPKTEEPKQEKTPVSDTKQPATTPDKEKKDNTKKENTDKKEKQKPTEQPKESDKK